MNTDVALRQRAEALLAQMTPEEKAGQLTQYFYFAGWDIQNQFVEEQVRAGTATSLLFVSDPQQSNRLQRLAVEESRLGIPLLFGFDVIHGLSTIFPVPLGMAASWDPQIVEQAQAAAAREARAVGIRWTFAPMVDIARDPRWGRIVEGAGEDPYLGAQMAVAQVRGFQGDGPGNADRVIAGPKHYLGYGAALGGRDYDEVHMAESEMRNVYLPPFAAAVAAGAGNIMTSYVGINGVPGAASRWLLQDVLRGELGFDGFVVSDAGSVRDLVTHGYARDERDAAARALNAGLDMEMALGLNWGGPDGPQPHAASYSQLVAAVAAGEVSQATLDDAVLRMLLLKLRLGLFDQPYVDEVAAPTILSDQQHFDVARIAAERSAVLLHNEQSILPLQRDALKAIAVIGPLANDRRATHGPWVFRPNNDVTITLANGLKAAAGDAIQVNYTAGVPMPERVIPSPFGNIEEQLGGQAPAAEQIDGATEFARAVELARSADVAIVALGEAADMNGECASRSTLDIPGRQLELLEAVAATGTPVVVVLMSGRPLDLRRVRELSKAILMAWHPGSAGGQAVARLLFGDVAPGGKLPFSWPRSVGQVPIIYSRLNSHQPHSASQRYWEEESTPLYPFGFGLTYGSVEYSNLQLSAASVGLDDTLTVSVDVHNPGARSVEEVAQLYIHQRYGRSARPVRELKGFERITLEAGATRTLQFTLEAGARRYWSAEDHQYVLDATEFDVWVGGDSTATLHGEFSVKA